MDSEYIIKNSKLINEEIKSIIYFLIDNDRIVYVGQSTQGLSRIYVHYSSGKVFDRYFYIECPEEQLNEMETKYIIKFSPTYNTTLPSNKYYKSVLHIRRKYNIGAYVWKNFLRKVKPKLYFHEYYDLREIQRPLLEIIELQ